MSSVYPGELDNLPTARSNTTPMTNTHPADHGNLAAAVNAIEATLGVNPQASYETVAAAILAALGGSSGASLVRGPFSFDYTQAGALAAGVAFYTPAVGDILLDAWVEVDVTTDAGACDYNIGTAADLAADMDPITFSNGQGTNLQSNANGTSDWREVASNPMIPALYNNTTAPIRFLTASPWLLRVNTTGLNSGDAITASAGAWRLYIVTATPTPFG